MARTVVNPAASVMVGHGCLLTGPVYRDRRGLHVLRDGRRVAVESFAGPTAEYCETASESDRRDGGIPGQKYVRFWDRVNGGWVKLTLFPGESLTHTRYARTDEGFRAETETWWVCEETGLLHNRVEGRERDCDGLVSYEHHYVVETTRAKLNYDPADPECPVWRREYSQNRDHTAEAAGY